MNTECLVQLFHFESRSGRKPLGFSSAHGHANAPGFVLVGGLCADLTAMETRSISTAWVFRNVN